LNLLIQWTGFDLGRFMGETRGTGGRIFDVACIYDKKCCTFVL